MPRYVKSLLFKASSGDFNTKKDDAVINETLQSLRDDGAEVLDITVRLTGSAIVGQTALYVIEYEAPRPL